MSEYNKAGEPFRELAEKLGIVSEDQIEFDDPMFLRNERVNMLITAQIVLSSLIWEELSNREGSMEKADKLQSAQRLLEDRFYSLKRKAKEKSSTT